MDNSVTRESIKAISHITLSYIEHRRINTSTNPHGTILFAVESDLDKFLGYVFNTCNRLIILAELNNNVASTLYIFNFYYEISSTIKKLKFSDLIIKHLLMHLTIYYFIDSITRINIENNIDIIYRGANILLECYLQPEVEINNELIFYDVIEYEHKLTISLININQASLAKQTCLNMIKMVYGTIKVHNFNINRYIEYLSSFLSYIINIIISILI